VTSGPVHCPRQRGARGDYDNDVHATTANSDFVTVPEMALLLRELG
jgi:hypothetical protein